MAQTLDQALFARAVFAGIGLPFGFLRWMRETSLLDEVLHIGLRTIGRIGEDLDAGVRL